MDDTTAGGGPADDIARASKIYADDAVLEWPQGGERIRGKAGITAFRSAYDDRPVMAVGIMEFRDGKVVRERIYFGEPWEPPAWRAQWVERMDELRTRPATPVDQSDPVRI